MQLITGLKRFEKPIQETWKRLKATEAKGEALGIKSQQLTPQNYARSLAANPITDDPLIELSNALQGKFTIRGIKDDIGFEELKDFFTNEANRMISILKDHSQLKFTPAKHVHKNPDGETFQTFYIDDPKSSRYLGAFAVQLFNRAPTKTAAVFTVQSNTKIAGKPINIVWDFRNNLLEIEVEALRSSFVINDEVGALFDYHKLNETLNDVIASNETLKTVL